MVIKKKKNPDLFSEVEEPIQRENPVAEHVFSVSEYIEVLNVGLKQEVRLVGEVTKANQYPSGHVYFTVKDAKKDAVMDCVIWKFNYLQCGVKLEAGMEVILTGHPQVYAPTGRFSFVARLVELKGEGALKKAYDDLKKRLAEEGLFAPERKRAIPTLPRRIGVVTSKEGAVIHDFINNLGKFGYEVNLIDSRVEGQQAVGSLLEAVRAFKGRDIEVLVIIRGGGSLESLQAFNNEMLVRELAAFPVPVIAGIGHDQDVPLVALMADAMTSTPTAAAHLLNKSWEDAYSRVRQFASVLTRVDDRIRRIRADLDLALHAVIDNTNEMFVRAKERLAYAEKAIILHNPERQLALGYSIARKHGKVIRSIEGIVEGDEISIQFGDGEAETRVESKNS